MSRVAPPPALHIVTDDEVLSRPDFLTVAAELLVVLQWRIALHIRGKATATAHHFNLANALAAKAQFVGAHLLLNDRADIALAFEHTGVQLGARSLPVASVRTILPKPRRIGFSAHSASEAQAAERDGADFVVAGSIYPTASHVDVAPGGTSFLTGVVDACSIPVIAIGGVDAARVQEVLSTGAYGVAVIRAVWNARDPVQAAEELVKILET